jgi:hypothetical protein
MNIKIKFPLDNNSYIDARLHCISIFLFFFYYGSFCLQIRFQNSRQSLLLASKPNMTLPSYASMRNIPYDECRCSILLNNFNNSVNCITDIQAMTGHIAPLLSCVLQLYLIYELFSCTGKYSRILKDIFWIAALFVFVIVAIGVHGSSYLNYKTNLAICVTDIVMFGCVTFLAIASDDHRSPYKRGNIAPNQKLKTNNDDQKNMPTIIVS